MDKMTLPQVYADFNAIEYPCECEGETMAEMPVTGYGTLASLAQQGLRLEEGMALLLVEPCDIECECVMRFDRTRKDPAGRDGAWIAVFDHTTIRDSTIASYDLLVQPCVDCGQEGFPASLGVRRNYTETCLYCGASVMAPMAPPADTG